MEKQTEKKQAIRDGKENISEKSQKKAKTDGRKTVLPMIAGVLVVVILLGAWARHCMKKYSDSHTWATLSITAEISGSSGGIFRSTSEVLKGDTIVMHHTKATVKNIKRDGTVTLSFEPGVINSMDAADTDKITIKAGESAVFREASMGDVDALWRITVTDHRYR